MHSGNLPVQTDVKIDRYSTVRLTLAQYLSLRENAHSYVIESGKRCIEFRIVHTTAGFMHLIKNDDGLWARWVADPLIVKGVVADASGTHFVDIDVGNRIVRIPSEGILPQRIDITLFGKGSVVSKVDRAHEAISMHLQCIVKQFEVEDARQIMGWREKGSALAWAGTNTEPPLLQYRLQLPSKTAYLEALSVLIAGCYGLQFALCASAASALLAFLRLEAKLPLSSFGLSLVGTSSTGKTSALTLAASFFSSPDDTAVYSGFYGTQNALVHLLGRHCGVPICFDESTIDNGMSKKNFVYAFAEGASKLRLDQNIQLKERETWYCTCLFSSETHLVDLSRNDNLGLGVRILNLEDMIYTRNAAHADDVKMFAQTNYGIVGNLLSDYLKKVDLNELLATYQTVKGNIGEMKDLQRCSLTDRLVTNFALIVHTAKILSELGIGVDIQEICGICVQIHNRVAADADPAKNIITRIFDYVSCKSRYLSGVKWTTDKNGKPLKVAIVETTFEEILQECGITDIKQAVRHLDQDGYLLRQSQKRIKSKLSIDGVSCYAYQFSMDKVREAFGKVDDTFTNVRKYAGPRTKPEEILSIDNEEEAVIHAGNYKIDCNKEAVAGKAFLL